MKKYILTDEKKEVCGHVLHRIQATADFSDVKSGDLGGWIESERNLSHYGNCWVWDNAQVWGDARVYGNAEVYGDARVYGNAKVLDNARVYNDARVYGDAEVWGNAIVYSDAKVLGDARVYGDAEVHGDAEVCGNAKVCGDAEVYGNAEVCGNARVCGNAIVYNDAKVREMGDYLVFRNNWSSGRYFTWTKSNDKWKVGCFFGTGEELIKKAYKDSELSGKCYEATVKYVEQLIEITKKMED